MDHILLTRAVYSPARWPLEANQRRLRVFAGITVRSLAAQLERRWRWLLAIDPEDQLLAERLEAARGAGVPVEAIPVEGAAGPRSAVAVAAYRASWADHLEVSEPRITTRLDDDDGFTPDAFGRIRGWAEAHMGGRQELHSGQLPVGFRVWGGRYTRVRHESNAMASLYSPAGDPSTVYRFMHREVRASVERVWFIDDRPAWLWVRHEDTLSGWRAATRVIGPQLRRMFPVTWELLEVSVPVPAQPGGEVFR